MEGKLFKIGATIFSVAGAIALISNNLDPSRWASVPRPITKENVTILFSILALIGLAIVIYASFSIMTAFIKHQVLANQPFGFHSERAVSADDLAWVHLFATSTLGEISPLELMKTWHRKNRNIIWIIVKDKRIGSVTRERCGFYCIMPLNADATRQIEAGILDGTKFRAIDVSSKHNSASSIYIGGTAATSRKARATAIAEIKHSLDFAKYPRVQRAYARAVTLDGYRRLKKYGFLPLDPANDRVGAMYYLERDD